MKKLLAVLLAALMIFSLTSVAFTSFAEGEVTSVEETTEDVTGEEEGDVTEIDLSDMPEWMQRVVERLVFVFTKLLIKFGIKIAIKGML